MDCLKFQDSLSEYVEGELDSRSRTECAAHRLICRDCRELYTDVRATMQALNGAALDDAGSLDSIPLEGLNSRILAATTAGEMLSCNEFDRLIERYFDGVLLAPTFQTFQAHFEKCSKCRRLMAGIEEAIEICHEIKEAEVDAPPSLQDRILAATVGPRKTSSIQHWKEMLIGFLINAARVLRTPQMVAALLIFAASSLLILSRFGSVSEMALHATNQAEQLQQKINTSGTMARSGFERVETLLFSGAAQAPAKTSVQPTPTPTPTPVALESVKVEEKKALQQSVRYQLQPHHSRRRD